MSEASRAAPTNPPDDAPGAAARRGRQLTARRSAGDVLLGVVLVVMGAFVLGDVVLAGVVSVLFLGWTLLIGGAIGVGLALLWIGRGGFWVGMISASLSLVAGLVFVRNPGVALLALSLVVGALLMVGGVLRIVAAVQVPEQRLILIVTGVLSLVLGLMMLNNWPVSALWLLGTLLGVVLVVAGRPHRAAASV